MVASRQTENNCQNPKTLTETPWKKSTQRVKNIVTHTTVKFYTSNQIQSVSDRLYSRYICDEENI